MSRGVKMFICANSARPGTPPTSAMRAPPAPLAYPWPFETHEILVPCAGKLQPEHLLKAFDAGAELVCVVACARDNCHSVEGCRRALRRVEYVGRLLEETGLGPRRLVLFHLPGSAREDIEAAAAHGPVDRHRAEVARRLDDLALDIAGRLKTLGKSPLCRNAPP